MLNWNELPFLRICAALIAGIWIQQYFPVLSTGWLIPGFLAIMGIVFLSVALGRIRNKSVLFIITFVAFAVLGWSARQLDTARQQPQQELIRQLPEVHMFSVKVISTPEKTSRSTRYRVIVQDIQIGSEWQSLGKDAIVYLNDSLAASLRHGSRMIIRGNLALLENVKNPHAFDYSLYLQRKGIWLQGFAQDLRLLPPKGLPTAHEIASRSADFLDSLLIKYIHGGRELNIARAMILGRRNEVDPEMDHAFQATGTSHILAVSGLHVGIIYLAATFLLTFLKQGRTRPLYYFAILALVWIYALITGLSPSVQRAATMLSFFIVAKLIGRDGNIYNTLFASAYFILLFSPALIYSVSFQLSFLAVLGILLLYDSIYTWIYVKNPVLNFFWKITALSLSVQLATFPVTIYYFHQFPALFAFTNLLAIPTATVVMLGGMSLLALSVIPPIAKILGWFLSEWLSLYNSVMLAFSRFSFTAIDGIYIKIPMVFLLMASVTFLILFFKKRHLVFFQFFTVVLMLMLAFSTLELYTQAHQKRVTWYSTQTGVAYDVFLGRTCFSVNTAGVQALNYSIEPNRRYHGIRQVKPVSELTLARSTSTYDFILIAGKSMLFLKESLPGVEEIPLEIDFLLLPYNTFQLPKNILFKTIVMKKPLKTLESNPTKEKLTKTHVVAMDGAWQISL